LILSDDVNVLEDPEKESKVVHTRTKDLLKVSLCHKRNGNAGQSYNGDLDLIPGAEFTVFFPQAGGYACPSIISMNPVPHVIQWVHYSSSLDKRSLFINVVVVTSSKLHEEDVT